MIVLLLLSALICCIPVFSLVNGAVARKGQFIINMISLVTGFMILSVPIGFLIGKALYYFSH
jgi:hypothetical protein